MQHLLLASRPITSASFDAAKEMQSPRFCAIIRVTYGRSPLPIHKSSLTILTPEIPADVSVVLGESMVEINLNDSNAERICWDIITSEAKVFRTNSVRKDYAKPQCSLYLSQKNSVRGRNRALGREDGLRFPRQPSSVNIRGWRRLSWKAFKSGTRHEELARKTFIP
ncbi:hypothetical protein KSP40_PGU009380 [Platanthera guangdongensis]|uniref:Uncharacterized protein n=1 Tax=Platanthera guangdongensis TaxID=2320717 RepID=A0ABR2LNF0_9ASPA